MKRDLEKLNRHLLMKLRSYFRTGGGMACILRKSIGQ